METSPYYNDLVRTEAENPRKSAYKDAKFQTGDIRSQADVKESWQAKICWANAALRFPTESSM